MAITQLLVGQFGSIPDGNIDGHKSGKVRWQSSGEAGLIVQGGKVKPATDGNSGYAFADIPCYGDQFQFAASMLNAGKEVSFGYFFKLAFQADGIYLIDNQTSASTLLTDAISYPLSFTAEMDMGGATMSYRVNGAAAVAAPLTDNLETGWFWYDGDSLLFELTVNEGTMDSIEFHGHDYPTWALPSQTPPAATAWSQWAGQTVSIPAGTRRWYRLNGQRDKTVTMDFGAANGSEWPALEFVFFKSDGTLHEKISQYQGDPPKVLELPAGEEFWLLVAEGYSGVGDGFWCVRQELFTAATISISTYALAMEWFAYKDNFWWGGASDPTPEGYRYGQFRRGPRIGFQNASFPEVWPTPEWEGQNPNGITGTASWDGEIHFRTTSNVLDGAVVDWVMEWEEEQARYNASQDYVPPTPRIPPALVSGHLVFDDGSTVLNSHGLNFESSELGYVQWGSGRIYCVVNGTAAEGYLTFTHGPTATRGSGYPNISWSYHSTETPAEVFPSDFWTAFQGTRETLKSQ